MSNFFVIIFLLSFVGLPILLVRPALLRRLVKKIPSRKTIAIIFSVIIFASFVGIGLTAPPPSKSQTPITATPAVQTPPPVVQQENSAITASEPVVAPTDKPSSANIDSDHQYYSVIEVVDGDTLKISIDGKGTTLRLIGMDTPEVLDPRKPVQCFGAESSNKSKELLSMQKVRIEKDPTQGDLDKYGRTLAYIYRSDGLFYNEYMIEQGYAHEYTYHLPYKYQAEFKAAQKEAQENKRGLWSPNTCNGDTTKPVASPQADAPDNTPVVSAPVVASTTNFYTSSYGTSKYYYPSSCQAWQSLSSKYLKGFTTLAELLTAYPSRKLSPQCQ